MSGPLLFLTGGTGFIGRHLLARLTAEGSYQVRCLVRRAALPAQVPAGIETVVGDVQESATYAEALRGSKIVLHLAGVTGKARRADYFAVNDGGTRALLAACVSAGVGRVLFVSTIATTYPDQDAYYYAQSKQLAEQAVRQSGLNYLIVRPTLVLGTGSPIWHGLLAFAGLPVMPIFGDGPVKVQPIHVDDVVTGLMSMIEDRALPDCAVDLGGPDVVTFEDLLRRIRRALRGREAPIVHVSARRTKAFLTWMERWCPVALPVTAGQLSAFVNDSVAAYHPLVAEMVPSMTPLDDVLHRLIDRG